uniref:Uncharacterized protein n=1 Tax=Magallana gigas TaxID=29159 RepID=K1PP70_MAGGI
MQKVRNQTTETIECLTKQGSYTIFDTREFCRLRDALVCRLTLFNARRGGEASRMTLEELQDALNDKWIDKSKAEGITDDEVEETRVKETTFPEIEGNDTPDTEQDSFDMGDLPPPPPPLPSINESISNDFPPPPFIEMMGNMTVDMGTPLEEGPHADEPLPSPPRLPLETFVPLVGRKGEEASFGFAAMHASSGTIGVVQGFPYRHTRPSEEIPGTANIATECCWNHPYLLDLTAYDSVHVDWI